MSEVKALQIAIDGPAASGKTTVARMLAQRLHLPYFDTGAMYRALAALALSTRTDVDNGAALIRLLARHPLTVELDAPERPGFAIRAGGDASFSTALLDSNEVTAIVSTVAAHPEVRAAMVAAQRAVAIHRSIVMAGRDIGTVVLPDATLKVFLTASVEARVIRRQAQLRAAGIEIDDERLRRDIEERDRLDRTRATSPLIAAPDARTIDSSDLDAAGVVDRIVALLSTRQARA